MRRLRENGLTIVLSILFLASLFGMVFTGHTVANDELAQHGRPPENLLEYVTSGEFLSALFENWESEFLQMSAYVVLTAKLFQRGSAESRDPDDPDRPDDLLPTDMQTRSVVLRWLYARSLGLVLFLFFGLSFIAHWFGSINAASQQARLHDRPAPEVGSYLADAQFWFESFQNWQSEFMATAVLVVLSIFLRFQGSPESKPAGAPNRQTGS